MPDSAPLRLPSFVRVRVIPPPDARASVLERVTWLTPYEAETIGEDARRAGPGTQLEVTVPPQTDAAGCEAVRLLFAWLRPKGIEVVVVAGDDEG